MVESTKLATIEDKVITLKGSVIGSSGKISRSEYFNFLDDVLTDSDIVYTPEQARVVSNHIRKLSTGSSAMVPLWCAGPRCPFAQFCPLEKQGIAPVGRPCPIEQELLKGFIMRFMHEFDVDPTNFTEVGYCNELAEIEIYLARQNMILSKPENATLLIEQSVGVDSNGDPIMQQQISPSVELRDRFLARKSRIIKLMVGDRQEKYKKEAALKIKLDDDPSTQNANMRAKLEKLGRQLDAAGAEFEAQQSLPPASLSPEQLIASTIEED